MSPHMETTSSARRVGDEVRAAMARRRVSQAALGKHLELSQAAVSRRLLGEIPFDISELTAIASFLGVPLETLVSVAA